MKPEVHDPWLLALERAENFTRTFNVPKDHQHNLARSYDVHALLAVKDEVRLIVEWLRANKHDEIADDIAARKHRK